MKLLKVVGFVEISLYKISDKIVKPLMTKLEMKLSNYDYN